MRRTIKPPGKCIFCGRIAGTKENGVPIKMSKQHFWPEWLQSLFPNKSDEHTVFKHNIKYQYGAFYVSPSVSQKQGDVKSKKVKVICERYCNNGWISALENKTKVYLKYVLLGREYILSGDEQLSLALWLSVMATVGEYTDIPTKAIPEIDRHYIFEKREPPPKWSIWVGQYRGIEWHDRYRHHGVVCIPITLPPNTNVIDTKSYNTQTTALQIGALFAYVCSSTIDTMWRFNQAGEIAGLTRIWPPAGFAINWPRLDILDDEAALRIADRIIRITGDALKTTPW